MLTYLETLSRVLLLKFNSFLFAVEIYFGTISVSLRDVCSRPAYYNYKFIQCTPPLVKKTGVTPEMIQGIMGHKQV